jgi:hypothetical protein
MVTIMVLISAATYYFLSQDFQNEQKEILINAYDNSLINLEQDIQRSFILLQHINTEIINNNLTSNNEIKKILKKPNYSQNMIFGFFNNNFLEWNQTISENRDEDQQF